MSQANDLGGRKTSLVYLERDGKYLMLHRTKKAHDENGDKWIGVGGKFELGETPDACALREVREETGLTMTDFALRGLIIFVSDVWGLEYMYLYTAAKWRGKLVDCDEGELVWLDKKELLKKNLWEGDRLFLKALDERTEFFMMKFRYAGERLAEVVDSRGLSPFCLRVYLELLNVRRGETITYGELARRIGCGSAQAVGQALRHNPFAPEVPCHRVVAADGSLCGFGGSRGAKALKRKRTLLRDEGTMCKVSLSSAACASSASLATGWRERMKGVCMSGNNLISFGFGLGMGIVLMTCSATAETHDLSPDNPSYQFTVQSGSGVTRVSDTCNLRVPADMVAQVTVQQAPNGFSWHNCESSTFSQSVNGALRSLLGQTTEFASDTTLSFSMSCSPAIAWTEIPEVGYLGNGMPLYGHYVYHYYSYYYAKMTYQVSAMYVRLLPDLVVSSLALSSSDVAVDEIVTLSYVVSNSGRKNVDSPIVVRIYDGTRQICGNQSVPKLAAGAVFKQTVTLPKMTAGQHKLKVVVDEPNAIEESSESNNSVAIQLRDYDRVPVVVTFDTNGGASARTCSVMAGSSIGELPVPTRTGYAFAGWWTEPSGGYRIDASEKITQARIFHAHWTAVKSEITFNNQGGSVSPSPVQVSFGSPLPTTTVPVKIGYRFDGYWSEIGGQGVQYYAASCLSARNWDHAVKSATLYAKWIPLVTEIALDVRGGTGGSCSAMATFERELPQVTPPTKSGWTFQGYYSSTNGVGIMYYGSTGMGVRIWDQVNESAVTLYAHWLPNQMEYVLTLDGQGGDARSVTATYASEMPRITPPKRDQHVFQGYFTEPNGGGVQYYDETGEGVRKWDLTPRDGTLYAAWTKAFCIRLDPNGASGVAACQYFTEPDWRLRKNIFVRDGLVFAGWAFEPDGVPVLADEAIVNKIILGYGDDPAVDPVTLYAVWGKSLTTSLFPGMNFVTGGMGSDPYWYEEDGALRSAQTASNSWLSATFKDRGELSGRFTLKKNVVSCLGIGEIKGDYRWADECTIYTNTSMPVSSPIPSDGRVAVWSCRKTLLFDKWGQVTPSDDKDVLSEMKRRKQAELDVAVSDLQRVVVQYLISPNPEDKAKKAIAETVDAYQSHCGMGVFTSYLLRVLGGKYGANVKELRDNAIFVNQCNVVTRQADQVDQLEFYVKSHASVSQLSFDRSCLVAFALGNSVDMGRAIKAKNGIFGKEMALESLKRSVCQNYVSALKPMKTNWSDRDEQIVQDLVGGKLDSAYLEVKEGSWSRTSFCSYIQSRLANTYGYNVSYLRDSYLVQNTLNSLLSDLYWVLSDILALERRIEGCGILEWRESRFGTLIGDLPAFDGPQGYSFDGWWTAPNGGVRVTESTPVETDAVYYAHLVEKTHRLSFAGVSSSYEGRVLTEFERIGFLPMPTREGWEFAGWVYEDDRRSASIFDTLLKDATLQAVWTEKTDWSSEDVASSGWTSSGAQQSAEVCSLAYSSGMYCSGAGQTAMKIAGVALILEGALFERTGYVQTGWSRNADGSTRDYELGALYETDVEMVLYPYWSVGERFNPKKIVVTDPYAVETTTTLDGCLFDADGLTGVVQLKLGKVNLKKGVSKVSAKITTLDGKRYSSKEVTASIVPGQPVTVSLEVKRLGSMSVTIGGNQFCGLLDNANYIQSASVGGDWMTSGAGVYLDTGTGMEMIPGEVQYELLPDGEPVEVKSGKWAFAKAAAVKWLKPKGETEKRLVIDTSKGKTNLSGLKLTYTPKTGMFKGSFKLYALEGAGAKTKLKTYSVKVSGVVVEGVGYGVATVNKPSAEWPVTVGQFLDF